jgi:hypothetical protein
MSRLYPISYGAGVLLVPDFGERRPEDERIVRPTRPRKDSRRARV